MSGAQSRLGAGAEKLRFTRSSGRCRSGAGTVVRLGLPLTTPEMPRSRISLATRSRPQETPSRWSWRQIFSAP